MSAFIVAAVMGLTVLLVMVGGIGLSYLAAETVLRLMARPQPAPSRVLTAARANSSGD